MIGRIFGEWTVTSKADPGKRGVSRWLCECSCGTVRVVLDANLRHGLSTSCGCSRVKAIVSRCTTHGKATHGHAKEYMIWSSMKGRCTNPTNKRYTDYGGRGITVCDDWLDFSNFHRDMGDKPFPRATIDRIDNDKGYSPENCRWATYQQQGRNKSDNRRLMYNSKEYSSLGELAEYAGISYTTLRSRLRYGWSVEKAVETPLAVVR